MSLPPGFLDELRSRLSLAQVVGRKVAWDMRKSNQGRGDWWAPCPFHQERTASFHVDDRQGFYYCFGCHAKGDAIGFVKETENVGFMEAVAILAREAGMQLPDPDPKAREKADRRSRLFEVMEQAVQWFRLQLRTSGGAAAREYLARRRLSEAAQGMFELGWAPDDRNALAGALAARGIDPALLLDAGLTAEPEGGGARYDWFRGRVVFPIRDGQGRCVGFGGRSLDPNARSKYLNTRQTELFDKGRELYNHRPAREAAGRGQRLVVAEGYMDVIALVEAGFGAAVAPLGTAVTEDQLRLMWRIADEPVIALDGDAAGMRAALRVIDLALPLVEAGKGLRFALLPAGRDPDDLIRAEGPKAMRAVLDGALPMVELLWRRETEGRQFDSPERRAALDRDLRAAVRRIADVSIRRHYGEELNRRRQELFRPPRAQGGRPGAGRRTGFGPEPVRPETRGSAPAALPGGEATRLREALVLAVLVARPELIHEHEALLDRLEMADAGHEALRSALHRRGQDPLAVADPVRMRALLAADLGEEALERLFSQDHVRIAPALRAGEAGDLARLCLAEQFGKLLAPRAAEREMQDFMQDIQALPDEGMTWRVAQAAEARSRALRAEGEDPIRFDTGPNGAAVNRDEKAEFQALLDAINYSRRRRGD